MEATREIYWNIGVGINKQIYLFALAAFGFMVWGLLKKLPVWRQGKAVNRLDNIIKRCNRLFLEVISQKKVYRNTKSGILHTVFFWSFLSLLIGTLLVMLQADICTPLLNRTFLSGNFYKAFSLVLDLAGVASLIMLSGLAVRHFITKTDSMETARSDLLILLLLITIMITGFFVEAVRIAATELYQNPELALFSPGGLLIAKFLHQMDKESLLLYHRFLWWLHFMLALGFFCAIPYTRLRHIFTISANTFLTSGAYKGAIATINLEDTAAEQFGVATIADFTWKDIFDADACVSCGRCQDSCPAHITGKPLSPMLLIKQIGEQAQSNPAGSFVDTVGKEAIWACTTCGACQDICPANIEHVNKILELRRNLTLMEGDFAGAEVRHAMNTIEVNGNPFGSGHAARGDVADGLAITLLDGSEPVDILYFVGCYGSFDSRNRQVASNFLKICTAAGIKVGILGKQELCCGEPVRKMGNEYLYQILATKNIERIRSVGVKKIVTTCPHCFNTLSRDYRDLGMDIPVEHYSTFINRLISDQRLKLTQTNEPFDCTYHDSCYLGRYMDLLQEPRKALKAVGGRLIEMEKSGYDSFCCGAGGGRILCEENAGARINLERLQMAERTGAPMLVSNCPFCLTMFEDGIKCGGYEGRLVAKDLAEVIAERVTSNCSEILPGGTHEAAGLHQTGSRPGIQI